MTNEAKLARIKEIEDRLDFMAENYSGCDWCCGGGDEEKAELKAELEVLNGDMEQA